MAKLKCYITCFVFVTVFLCALAFRSKKGLKKSHDVRTNRDEIRYRAASEDDVPPMLPAGQDDFNSNEVEQEIVNEPNRPSEPPHEHGHGHDHGYPHKNNNGKGHDQHGHGKPPDSSDTSDDHNVEEPANFNANSGGGSSGDCEERGHIKDKYTFVALIDIMFADGCKRTCTGAIIHDNVVITAAHCFTNLRDPFVQPELSLSFIVIGTKRMFETGYEQYLPIERVVTHPRFRGWTADLALVFTFANMDSDKPGKVLPLYLEKSSVPVDSNVTVFSWGKCRSDLSKENDPKKVIKYLNSFPPHLAKKHYNSHHHYKKPNHYEEPDNNGANHQDTVTEIIESSINEDNDVSNLDADESQNHHTKKIYQRDGEGKLDPTGQYNKQNKVEPNIDIIPAVRATDKNFQHKNQQPVPIRQTSRQITVPPVEGSMYMNEKFGNKQTFHQYNDDDRLPQGFTDVPKQRKPQIYLQSYRENYPQYSNNQPPPERQSQRKPTMDNNKQQQRESKGRTVMALSLSAENKRASFSVSQERINNNKDQRSNAKVHKTQENRPNFKNDEDRNARRGHHEAGPAIMSFFDLQDYDGQSFVSLASNKTDQINGDEPFLEMIRKGIKKSNQPIHQHNNDNEYFDNRRYNIRPNKAGSKEENNNNYKNQNNYKKSTDNKNVRYVRNGNSRHKVRRQMPHVHYTHDFQYFHNWRRTIGQQHNNLSVGLFGYVNIASCKKTIERSLPPMYEINNKHEYLCYTSEEFYITNEDSGAPVVQKDELVAVTIGGIDSEGDHIAVGIKIACFCNWIAFHLPNHDGAKLRCCHGCCTDRYAKPHDNHSDHNTHHSEHLLRSGQKLQENENEYYPRLYENQNPSKKFEPQGAMYRLASSDDGKQIENENQPEFEAMRKSLSKINITI